MRPVKFAMTLARWTIPPGFLNLLRLLRSSYRQRLLHLAAEERTLVRKNRRFKGLHTGKRCFILATGPSIRTENFKPLKNEICIATSDFYKHEDYRLIRPRYYCFAPIHPPFDRLNADKRLLELSQKEIHPEIFIPINDRHKGVYAEKFFANDRVTLLCSVWGNL